MSNKKHAWYLLNGGGGGSSSSFYLYHDAITKTYRNNADFATSNLNRQVFPISNFEDDDYYYVYFAGDGSPDGLDRTYLTRKSKSDGLHINKGWEWYNGGIDTNPTEILGLGPEVWNNKQNFLGQILPKDGGGYIGIYTANGPIVSSAYLMGTVESNDLINWTRTSADPLIPAAGGVLLIHGRAVRDINDPSILHLFGGNSGGTGGRLYRIRHYTTTWNDDPSLWPEPTLVDDDMYNGAIPDEEMLGEMGIIWIEGGEYHWFSSVDARWGYPALSGRVTQESIQATIIEYKSPDFSTITEVRRLHTTDQQTEIAHICLCGKMEHNGKEFVPIAAYKWRMKALLTIESEPFINIKMLTQEPPEDGERTSELVRSTEVWPLALTNGFILRPDQAQEPSMSPIEAITKTPMTVVGAPTRAHCSQIQPVSGGYVRYDGNVVLDTKYFGVKFLYETVFNPSNFSMFCFMRASDSKVVLKAETIGTRLRVTLVGADGISQKIYRLSATITTTDTSPINGGDTMVPFYILWRNGTLQLGGGYNPNMTTFKDTDNAFTDIFSGGDTFKLGVGAVDTDFCQEVVGPVMILNGVDYATEANLVNLDLT